MEEEWRDIEGYDGVYQISNLGRVRRYTILKQFKNHKGYFTTQLSKNNKGKTFLVHRLVAKAFILNKDNKKQVNHKDGDKSNNKALNLEWCTNEENSKHAWETGLMERVIDNNKKRVNQYALDGTFIKTWESLTEANKSVNGTFSSISACCRNKPYAKSAYGYIWKYEEDVNNKKAIKV